MRFGSPLQPGFLEKRYKRFLADVRLPDGEVVTCHCPNTGSMLGCADPGLRVWLSRASNPRRKYRYTWELVEVASGALVGVHTGRTNRLVGEAIDAGWIPRLRTYTRRRAEVNVPSAPMRADFRLTADSPPAACFVEVKNVTAAVEDGTAFFPDAVSERGRRHLEVLAGVVRGGDGHAVNIFCAQRNDVQVIRPADAIDPAYGRALRDAAADGVDLVGLAASVTPEGIVADRLVPVELPPINDQ